MAYETLIQTEILRANLGHPDWAIFDCRFDLAQPEHAESHYKKAHIPGALYAHLERDLSTPACPEAGRHPLPTVAQMQQVFSAWGIDDQVQVVVYDDDGGGYAARLWWMLRYLGHPNAALLDGGFSAWKDAGLPVRSGEETRAARAFYPSPQEHMLVQAADVLRILKEPSHRIVDSRAPKRYLGEEEPLDPIAGRIPGAVNRFWQDNLVAGSRFLDLPTLKAEWKKIDGSIEAMNTIVYCGSGVTGCQNVFAMTLAGFGTPKLYAGSWSQWLHIPEYPQAAGPPEE